MDDKNAVGIRKDYGKLPHWPVDCGVLPILTGNDVRVLVDLVRWADYKTGIGRIGNKRIAKESGVSYSSISKSFKNLKRLGVIKTWKKGWVRYYQILPNFDLPPGILSRTMDMYPRKSEAYRDPISGRFTRTQNE